MAYVPAVARRYAWCGVPMDELMAAGNVGLVEAALRYDPAREVRFVTYADWWIRKTILKTIQEQAGAVRIPRYRLERMRNLRALRGELRAAHGREPDTESVARAAGMTEDEVRKLLAIDRSTISLDQPVSSAGDRLWSETIPDPSDHGRPDALIGRDYAGHVRRSMTRLDPRERVVLVLRFGFLGGTTLTLREVGSRLGISRERVRQIERRAVTRLRSMLGES